MPGLLVLLLLLLIFFWGGGGEPIKDPIDPFNAKHKYIYIFFK